MSRTIKLLAGFLLLTSLASCSSDSDAGSTTQAPASATDTTAAEQTTAAPRAPTTTTVPSADSGSLAIDPCGLLTAGEITAVTGVEFGEGTVNDVISGAERAACDWISIGSEFATAQVLVVDAGADQFDVAMAGAQDVFGLATEPVDVPGADRTYATAEGSIVAMSIDGIFVQVAYIPSGPGNVLDATLQLATTAAGRMP